MKTSSRVKIAFFVAILCGLADIAKPVKARFLREIHEADIPETAEDRELIFGDPPFWVSVCGMELQSVLSLPQFFLYAVPALVQAWIAPGNVKAAYLPFANFNLLSHRTLSVWNNQQDMLNFVNGGPHANAVAIIPQIAVYAGKINYETDNRFVTFFDVLGRWEAEKVAVFEDGMVVRHV